MSAIAEHAVALLVVLPLLGAPLCVILGRGSWASLLATAIAWVTFGLALSLQAQVEASGTISYAVGGWAPPVGIELRVDAAAALIALLLTGVGALLLPYARPSVEKEVEPHRHAWFYACLLLCYAGLLGMTVTGDAFNLFVFLEISSLSTYVLVSIGKDRRALTAAFRYLLMGTVGATFYLLGIGFLFLMTGTLNMADLAARLADPAVHGTTTVRAGLALITVGLSLKMALWPLHVWLPNVYAFAPSAVSAFLSATATKVAVFVLLRIFYTVDGRATPFAALPIADTMPVLAVLGAVIASTIALYQENAKRLLAYSSVAQIGYIALGIGLATQAGLAAGLLHLFNHALMKGALFCALGCLVYRTGTARLAALRGAGRQMPWTGFAILLGGLSLIGVPLTAGFVSKWMLVSAVLQAGRWPLAVLLLIASLLSILYVGQLLNELFLKPRPKDSEDLREAPLWMLVPTLLLALANLWFGVRGDDAGRLARAAAEILLETAR